MIFILWINPGNVSLGRLALGLGEKPFPSMSTASALPWELFPVRDELYPAQSFSLISAALPLNKPITVPISSPSSELCLFPGPDKQRTKSLERVLGL